MQSAPQGHTLWPSHRSPGEQSSVDQHPPDTGSLQTPLTQRATLSSPQSRSCLQQPGVTAQTNAPRSHVQVHAPSTSGPLFEQLAQTIPSQPAMHSGVGRQSHPPSQTSQASGEPQHVPGEQSCGNTVPGGQTHRPPTHSACSGK